MSDGTRKSKFLLRLVPALILIGLLAWCTANKRDLPNNAPVVVELRELFMQNGLIDSPKQIDLASVAKKVGEPGMNRLLYEAAKSASLDALTWIVKHGAVPSNVGTMGDLPLLHRVALTPHYERLNYFLSLGLDPLERGSDGSTALHYAAQGGLDERTLSLLLSKKLNIDDSNRAGQQPIHFASVKSIAVLVAAGADLSAKDIDGRTPLHQAVLDSQNAIAVELIRNGASVHETDKHGRTPLHLAAMTNRPDTIIDTLLEAGALKTARDNEGMTARDLAEEARETRNRYVSIVDKL